MVGTYLRYYTFRSREELEELDRATVDHPERRAAQRALAVDVVGLVHGADEAGRAVHASEVLFSEDIRDLDEATLLSVLADVPSTTLGRTELDALTVVDLLVRTGLEASRGAARRTVEQGGGYVNNRKADGPEARVTDLLHGRYAILRKGKARQHVLRVGA
ncbi:MAG: hypothetical protein NVSMB12_22280 [Acidimicrobiales bacterium]